MVPKIPKKRSDGGSSFYRLTEYITGGDDKADRAIYVQTRNTFCTAEDGWETAAAEMNALGIANVRCADPVFHFILSFRPEEKPLNKQVDEAVDIALKELNLEKCKVLYGLQNDNGIHHIHVCACRIDPETERAISPAGGWSKKALMKASRKIEIAQGWEILREDPFWDVTDDGKVVAKGTMTRSREAKLDTNAQDFEAHTGAKSAQTLAIEKAAPIIQDSRTWLDLHLKLAEVGIKFELKGSGAVIVVGDEIVKASNAGRDCSLSKLERRLGVFYKHDCPLANANTDAPAPTKQTETTEKTLSAWKRYQLYKKEHGELKELKNSFFNEHKGQREKLRERHKNECDTLFRSRPTWKGHGKELNYERMVLASRQLRERLLLREKQKAEREKLPDVPQFLSYRKWLAENQPEIISDLRNWRESEQREKDLLQVPVLQIHSPDVEESEEQRRKMFTTLHAEESQLQNVREKSESLLKNFAAYRAWQHSDKKRISYSLDKNAKTAFVEMKDGITIFDNTESSLLAALQLAQSKWKIVKLDGTKENLDICMKLAKEYNIKIQVPEKYLETLKNEKREQTEREKQAERDERVHEPNAPAAVAPQDIPVSVAELQIAESSIVEPPAEEDIVEEVADEEKIPEHESYLEMDDIYGEILNNKNSERCRSRYHPIHEKMKRLDEIVFYVKEQSRGTPVDVDYLEEFRYAHKISKLTTLDAQRMEDRNDRGR